MSDQTDTDQNDQSGVEHDQVDEKAAPEAGKPQPEGRRVLAAGEKPPKAPKPAKPAKPAGQRRRRGAAASTTAVEGDGEPRYESNNVYEGPEPEPAPNIVGQSDPEKGQFVGLGVERIARASGEWLVDPKTGCVTKKVSS